MTFILGRVLVLTAWSSASWAAVFLLPPIEAVLVVGALTAALGWRYIFRPRRRERAALRLRRPGKSAVWLLAVVPVWILFHRSLAAAHTTWISPPPETPHPLEELALQPMGWLPIAVAFVLFAPLSEEIFFRGFIQRALEHRLGAGTGVLLSALAFAAVHLEPWRFGHLLAGGLVFGAFVQASRTLWVGVTLHVGANAASVLLDGAVPPLAHLLPPPGSAGALIGHPAVLLSSLLALVALHRAIRRSAHSP